MTQLEKENEITNAKRSAKWLRVEIKVSIFGVTLFHKVFPPDENE